MLAVIINVEAGSTVLQRFSVKKHPLLAKNIASELGLLDLKGNSGNERGGIAVQGSWHVERSLYDKRFFCEDSDYRLPSIRCIEEVPVFNENLDKKIPLAL